ncbi:CRP/FNR family transcriptional regulator [Caldanaerobacter subterraneus subsp. tengcongensis MB4]|uniref:cAMP-binding domains-Catabolite gene activator and regulatory subunit of cAMP-dependent protein kinases n=1 Tax=Caldanaerobacter subterraneus subsp. tengcongensis (strain DSM 15242 / JCM 11007 / NBRC 100824 / MB4) TaxID=273068 RepID=Q8R5P4_CALS4|nr:cAMP-binding domains - Catabolite gene activator and regulatory subunit of cAMP-dependent protein kinases [Caldanaerobacter subterraneus subsp. tengcongensis MB4]MCS3917238.1 CRP/FNR family transcriptional regulator [Caldanaerobacter subterraneus subsp. tengcongensis MB4]
MKELKYLRKIPYFSELEDEKLEKLHNIATLKPVKKGCIIFTEGQKGEAIYFVKTGKIKISKISSVGKEYTIKIMEEGDVFGESTLFIGGEYPATAEAIEDSEILELRNKDIEDLILKDTQIALSIIKILAKRLKYIAVVIENLALRDSVGRTASILLTFARERGISTKEGILVEIDLKRQELANLAGTSRENITRILSQMDRDGIIKLGKDKILIKDLEELRKML